jgi:hypothetical protein
MVQKLIPLGPLNLPGKVAQWDSEMAALEHEVHQFESENGSSNGGQPETRAAGQESKSAIAAAT